MDNEARAFGNLLAAVAMSPNGSALAVEWYKQNKYAEQFSLDSWLEHIAKHMAIFNNMTHSQHRIVSILDNAGLVIDYRVIYVADAFS